MENVETILYKLKESGFRITPQREYIIKLFLEDKTHPTAEDIFNKIKKIFPSVSFSTVYSTLNTLIDIGAARLVKVDTDRAFFDPNTEPHSHFVCENCKKIIDIEEIKVDYKGKEGKALHTDIYVYGICTDCLSKINN